MNGALAVTFDQIALFAILGAMIGLFIWGRLRHDLVAMLALMACLGAGLVAPAEAFAGFGHPAVITVASVLIISAALQETGAVHALSTRLLPRGAGPIATIGALCALAAALSAFMNNVGALALLMPVGLQMASRLKTPPGRVLMPLAFASLLGGMTTLIGTPPNLIVSGFRARTGGAGYGMFDFAPVGLTIAGIGVIFIATIGWRLVPARQAAGGAASFAAGDYLTELVVKPDSPAAGMTIRALEAALADAEITVVGLARDTGAIAAPSPFREIHAGDVLLVEGDPKALAPSLSEHGLGLAENIALTPAQMLQSDDIAVMEVTVRAGAALVGLSAVDIALRSRYGINLLALSRAGARNVLRLGATAIQPSDILLVQGRPEAIHDFCANLGCVPLVDRALRMPDRRKAALASAVMICSVVAGASGLLPTAIAFAGGALAIALLGVTPTRRIYDAIDWSVIVLLAALMPVAGAVSTTGAGDAVARVLIDGLAGGSGALAVAALLVVTMTLSDLMNNAATAAVMSPIAMGAATRLGVNPDAFLMAVAIGASCSFLTPIGHQNNTLILGPGNFRFGDYWPLGLPLELMVIAVGVPALLFFWPL